MEIVAIDAATFDTSPAASIFQVVVRRGKKQIARLQLVRIFDPYRPERHYMRGPGLKWRDKHGLPEREL